MAIDSPISDTSRAIQHERDDSWPESVKIQVCWRDGDNRPAIRTLLISANQFFGRGQYGAPLEGSHLIQAIERMRREGPPKVTRRQRNSGKSSG
jgi:hypothetical protein